MSKIDLGHLGEAMETLVCHRMKESSLTTGFGWIHTTKLWLTSVYMCMCMWVGRWKWGHGRHLGGGALGSVLTSERKAA